MIDRHVQIGQTPLVFIGQQFHIGVDDH